MRAFPIVAVLGAMLGPVGWSALTEAPAVRPERATVGHQQQNEFQWSGHLDRGQTIEVQGVNGTVHAVRATGGEVEVVARKREGRRGNADDVTFDVVPYDGGVTICAMYPAPNDADRPNECRPGGRGHMSTRDNDTRVDFTVRVPAGVNFTGRTVNGGVETEALDGDVLAHTVNGDVDVTAGGHVEANTVNGSISASMGKADWTGDAQFTTVNGGITLDLPRGIDTDISARTVNGSFESDFPVTIEGRFGPKRISGRIGNGGRMLRLETVNGSIKLREHG